MEIKAIITGATGMIGKGVVLECLADPSVESILAINRAPIGIHHPKLQEVILADFSQLAGLANKIIGYNACFYCLGTSASSVNREQYHAITYDMTVGLAETLVALNPGMTFCYVSGDGTDSTEKGRSMWARVKGKTENALLTLPFKGAYMFRPAYVQPLKGVQSKTRLYAFVYGILKPFYPILKALCPQYVTTTEQVGKAMIEVAVNGYEKSIVLSGDIKVLAGCSE